MGVASFCCLSALQVCARMCWQRTHKAAAVRQPAATTPLAPMRWYHFLGGLLGALGFAITVTATPHLGLALYFACIVAGSLAAAAALDALGFVGMPRIPLSAGRILPLVAALVGVAMVTVSDTAAASGPAAISRAHQVGWCILVVLAGAKAPLHALLNWRVAKAFHSKPRSLLLSYTLSLAASLAICGVALAASSLSWAAIFSSAKHTLQTAPWLCLGGVGGLLTIAGGAHFPRHLSAASYFTLVLSGELVAALIFDARGVLGLPAREISVLRVAGVLMVLMGAVGMRFSDYVDLVLEVSRDRWRLWRLRRHLPLHAATAAAEAEGHGAADTGLSPKSAAEPAAAAAAAATAAEWTARPQLAAAASALSHHAPSLSSRDGYTSLATPAVQSVESASRLSSRLRRSRLTSLDGTVGHGLLALDTERGEAPPSEWSSNWHGRLELAPRTASFTRPPLSASRMHARHASV